MIDWWNSMSTASQIFACIAIPATLVLLIQTIVMFLGIGDDSDGIGDGDMDGISDAADIDTADGIFGEELPHEAPDVSGFDGLRIFTIRGIVAFFVVFGWVGVVMDSADAPLWATVPVAVLSGLAIMILLAVLFKAILRLRNDGNTDNRNAIGTAGKVQLTIPPSRTGEGKVHLMLQGSYVERNAVTDEETSIPTGSEVIVVGISGQTNLIVKRK